MNTITKNFMLDREAFQNKAGIKSIESKIIEEEKFPLKSSGSFQENSQSYHRGLKSPSWYNKKIVTSVNQFGKFLRPYDLNQYKFIK